MKNKKSYFNELNEIKKLTDKMKRMNESVMFEDDDYVEDFDNLNDEMPANDEQQEPTADAAPQDKGMSAEEQGMIELDKLGEVDKIRAITLEGMRRLANQPESPQFQALYKIFQVCCKSTENKDKEKEA